jgi:hypothetical protein
MNPAVIYIAKCVAGAVAGVVVAHVMDNYLEKHEAKRARLRDLRFTKNA